MQLSGKQKRYLRSLGHHLQPLAYIGKAGLDEPQFEAIRQALIDHELIKVKLGKACPIGVAEAIPAIEANTPGACVQKVGRMMLFYAPHPNDPEIELPKPGK